MRKRILVLVGISICISLNAQLKVKTSGQVEMNAGNGSLASEAVTIIGEENGNQKTAHLHIVSNSNNSASKIAWSQKRGDLLDPIAFIKAFSESSKKKLSLELESNSSDFTSVGITMSNNGNEFGEITFHSRGFFDPLSHNIEPNSSPSGIINPGDSFPLDLHPKGMKLYEHPSNGTVLSPVYDTQLNLGTLENKWNGVFAKAAFFDHSPVILSDERAKNSIRPIQEEVSSQNLFKLRPVVYSLKSEESSQREATIDNKDGAPLRMYGFLAQEMQEVYPNMVFYDSETDTYGIRYTELIPVMIATIQTMQQKIDNLEEQIISQKSSSLQTKGESETILYTSAPQLSVNVPNPFDHKTTIVYFVPAESADAYIVITDLQGKMLRNYPCIEKGKQGIIEVDAQGLDDGLYIYSLIVNNREIASHKMILKR